VDDEPERRRSDRSRTAGAVRWLPAVPVLGLAVPALYNRHDPVILGVPFFYAYQLLMIALTAACLLLARPPR
jgi:hypothetical protein